MFLSRPIPPQSDSPAPKAAAGNETTRRTQRNHEIQGRLGRFFSIALIAALVTATDSPIGASENESSERRSRRRALRRNEEGAFQGYTMISPLMSKSTYLVNMKGEPVHTWKTDFPPGNSEYLLANGNLLRTARVPRGEVFVGGGMGGRVQELTWDGAVVWDYVLADEDRWHHHDIAPLPNGNILLIVWERRSKEEALNCGRDPEGLEESEIWPDAIVEVKPIKPQGGEIVWEWHTWDHLIQDRNANGTHYGDVAKHPERVDINADRDTKEISDADRKRLEALGYIAPSPKPGRRPGPPGRGGPPRGNGDRGEGRPPRVGLDWMHTNSIDYNPSLDQIVISVRRMDEIWILDHSTTTEEAKGSTGGRWGKGGDLLYRWGNPKTYRRGDDDDQVLFGQHDARWIPAEYPGGGNLLIFNNGNNRPRRPHSAIEELTLPFSAERGYFPPKAGQPFGPEEPTWRYTAPRKARFFSSFISGAHRLPNGNTFICSGEQGRVFEVTGDGEIVWEWINPFGGDVEEEQDGINPKALFRATRLSPDHPGLSGRELGSPSGEDPEND